MTTERNFMAISCSLPNAATDLDRCDAVFNSISKSPINEPRKEEKK